MHRPIRKKQTKGNHTALCSNVDRFCDHMYNHRHRGRTKSACWIRKDHCETCQILKQLEKMFIVKNYSEGRHKKMFCNKSHIATNKYFKDDRVNNWISKKRFGFLHTVRRDGLPPGRPDWAFHKQLFSGKDHRTCLACSLQLITAVKPLLKYNSVHLYFQSTGPKNFSCVN